MYFKDILKKYFIKFLGITLIIVGIIGLFLPFLQGVLMIVTGWALLMGKSVNRELKKAWSFIKTKVTRR
jgi:uncharacterized protein YqgC (DUF456 family)